MKIDMILGAREYALILKDGLIKSNPNEPINQNTEFGWIVTGATVDTAKNDTSAIRSYVTTAEIDETLKQFFEIDDKVSKNIEEN